MVEVFVSPPRPLSLSVSSPLLSTLYSHSHVYTKTPSQDLGCGVGGPLREIARFTRAKITGVNNNEYQIKRGQKKNAALGIDWCNYQKADFMNLPFEDNEMDAAYAIEATCHAPDKVWFPPFAVVVCLSALWLVGRSVAL